MGCLKIKTKSDQEIKIKEINEIKIKSKLNSKDMIIKVTIIAPPPKLLKVLINLFKT